MRWFEFALLVSVSIVASLAVGLIENNRAVFTVRDYATTAASFFATGFLIVLIACLKGMPLQSLLDGLVFTPLKFSDLLVIESVIYRFVKGWALVAAIAAAAIIFFKKRKPFETEVATAFLKALFGLAVVFALLIGYYDITTTFLERVAGSSPMFDWVKGNDPLSSFLLLNFATPFLWLLVAEPLAKREFSAHLVSRAALALAAILQTLHIYPVPGSQMAPAVFLIAVVGIVCLSDAFEQLKILLPRSFGKPQLQAVLIAALSLTIFVGALHRTYLERKTSYYGGLPLNLKGSERIRLSEREVAAYNFLVENSKFNCDSIFSMPGIFSIYFWTEKESPTKFNVTPWMNLLNDSQQQSIVETLKTSERGCIIYNPYLARYWMWGLDNQDFEENISASSYLSNNRTTAKLNLKKLPLAAFILNNHTTAGEVNGYRFMRRNGTVEELVYAARFVPGEQNSIEFILPPQSGFEIHRIELFDLIKWRSVADSRTSQPIVLNRQNETVMFPLKPIDNSVTPRKYKLQWSAENQMNQTKIENLILRLYDNNNNLIASLPFPVN